mgnify:CR=1 FL=1
MVIVPAFAVGEDGQEPVVDAVVFNVVATFPIAVGDRVNAEGDVVDSDGAEEEAIDNQLRTGNAPPTPCFNSSASYGRFANPRARY